MLCECPRLIIHHQSSSSSPTSSPHYNTTTTTTWVNFFQIRFPNHYSDWSEIVFVIRTGWDLRQQFLCICHTIHSVSNPHAALWACLSALGTENFVCPCYIQDDAKGTHVFEMRSSRESDGLSFLGVTSNQKSTFENLVQSTIWKFPFAKKLQLCHKKC